MSPFSLGVVTSMADYPNLLALARRMSQSIPVKDRSYHLRTYKRSVAESKGVTMRVARSSFKTGWPCTLPAPGSHPIHSCFLGTDAVMFLIGTAAASSESTAIELGNQMIANGLLRAAVRALRTVPLETPITAILYFWHISPLKVSSTMFATTTCSRTRSSSTDLRSASPSR
jgi:hypothetical protein